ncbi:OmpA family protein [Comamonas testosteroni]|uniref:Peptidoglycan-associated lipoprotein n=1 Tax=Comamonas testosteroni (strain DSM 14576 / KF-1) TaxID=399795 RepID=B7WRF2_COMTK|nr:OmpA family protein [Comamonas testosteroni]EED67137.1 OmpA/MotB domain protein [Comamonas testosteroni KF-1]WQG65330.1 OmpA family protein [Comamonas testosteroni]
MHKNYRLCAALLLSLGLIACSSAPTSNKTSHHYAYGRPTVSTASGVAPIVATSQSGKKGPANAAHIVYFDFDSYTVRPSDRGIVESHAQWMRNNPRQALILRGHTDSRGGTEYNLALGQKRSESVLQSLQILGIDPSRVEAISYGKERLVDLGSSNDAHQLNRRVEFEYR